MIYKTLFLALLTIWPSTGIAQDYHPLTPEQDGWPYTSLNQKMYAGRIHGAKENIEKTVEQMSEILNPEAFPDFLAHISRRVATVDKSWCSKPMEEIFNFSNLRWSVSKNYLLRSLGKDEEADGGFAGADIYQKVGSEEWTYEPQASESLWIGGEFGTFLKVIFLQQYENLFLKSNNKLAPSTKWFAEMSNGRQNYAGFVRELAVTLGGSNVHNHDEIVEHFFPQVTGILETDIENNPRTIIILYKKRDQQSSFWFFAMRMDLHSVAIDGTEKKYSLPKQLITIVGTYDKTGQPIASVMETQFSKYEKFSVADVKILLDNGDALPSTSGRARKIFN